MPNDVTERTTVLIDRKLLAEAQRMAAIKGVPMSVAGSVSKFFRHLLAEYCAKKESEHKKG